jgi:F-type H+-transporting ATPase subunit delta
MEELIAKRYVQALLSIADAKERENYIGILNAIASTFDNADVREMIAAPIVSADKKVEAILSGLGKKVDEKIVNFIKILGEKKRLSLIPAIAEMLNAQVQKESNEYTGVVSSRETLGESEIATLEKTLKRYTGSNVKLEQVKSDLDGLRVAVEDLGIEVNFSKERVKEQLIDFIMKSQ